MSIDSAKTTLKITGILNIIFGALGIIVGISLFAGVGVLSKAVLTETALQQGNTNTMAALTGLAFLNGVFILLSGIVDLILGIFSLPAAKDPTKANKPFVLSIIAAVLCVITLVLNLLGGVTVSSVISGVLSIVFAGLTFTAAKTLKDSVQ